MDVRKDPRELVEQLLKRSTCAVQVAAVVFDGWGVSSWGWNSSGKDGLGQHAEAHAMSRLNPKRRIGSTIVVAARRRKNGRVVSSRPCLDCQGLIKGLRIIWRDREGWHDGL